MYRLELEIRRDRGRTGIDSEADATSRFYQSREPRKSMSASSNSNRFAHLADREPVVEDGIEYWDSQPASLNGVLGAYFLPNPFSQRTFDF